MFLHLELGVLCARACRRRSWVPMSGFVQELVIAVATTLLPASFKALKLHSEVSRRRRRRRNWVWRARW